jgi:hypothetical protein
MNNHEGEEFFGQASNCKFCRSTLVCVVSCRSCARTEKLICNIHTKKCIVSVTQNLCFILEFRKLIFHEHFQYCCIL